MLRPTSDTKRVKKPKSSTAAKPSSPAPVTVFQLKSRFTPSLLTVAGTGVSDPRTGAAISFSMVSDSSSDAPPGSSIGGFSVAGGASGDSRFAPAPCKHPCDRQPQHEQVGCSLTRSMLNQLWACPGLLANARSTRRCSLTSLPRDHPAGNYNFPPGLECPPQQRTINPGRRKRSYADPPIRAIRTSASHRAAACNMAFAGPGRIFSRTVHGLTGRAQMLVFVEIDGVIFDVRAAVWEAYSRAVTQIGMARTDEATLWRLVRTGAG